jgi:NitT/TauT family transport system ATP-binding protein
LPVNVMASDSFVALDNVNFAYGPAQRNVVECITLRVREYEFVAVVGPSGCGKTTLLKLCSGLLTPTAGTVSVRQERVVAPLKVVGMVFQSPTLLPWRTAIDNVLLPLEIVEPYRSTFRKQKAAYVERAQELLKSVGLDGSESKFPWELSGGMQQRVSICRALVHEPSLLLLDEPFSGLDALTREDLWFVLSDLWSKRRFTALLVTHDLREAAFLADTVYVMGMQPDKAIVRRRVDIPRPRDLDVTYSDRYVAIVQELRRCIGQKHKP